MDWTDAQEHLELLVLREKEVWWDLLDVLVLLDVMAKRETKVININF